MRTLKQHIVKLIRVKSNHKNLRTETVTGECAELPCIGFEFQMFAEPLEDKTAEARIVTTTPVKTLKAIEGGWRFTTENSTYDLKVLKGS